MFDMAVRSRHWLAGLVLMVGAVSGCSGTAGTASQESTVDPSGPFDHQYVRYADLLDRHVVGTRVDYRRLTDTRTTLETIVAHLGQVSEQDLRSWSENQRLAYWINAYNAFTLDAITQNYPIRNRWFTVFGFLPPNSIKQIPGVWSRLRWPAGGGERTLDEIEHDIIRVRFDEPRLHFAVNCAAISCPPLRSTPYVGGDLDTQLSEAARDFLDSRHGTQVEGSTLRVSRIFDWYGDDFVEAYASQEGGSRRPTDQAILGVVAKYGPSAAARLSLDETVDVEFLDYDWGLNDVEGS